MNLTEKLLKPVEKREMIIKHDDFTYEKDYSFTISENKFLIVSSGILENGKQPTPKEIMSPKNMKKIVKGFMGDKFEKFIKEPLLIDNIEDHIFTIGMEILKINGEIRTIEKGSEEAKK